MTISKVARQSRNSLAIFSVQGQVLIEGVISIFVALLSICLIVETYRRGCFEMMLSRAPCRFLRVARSTGSVKKALAASFLGRREDVGGWHETGLFRSVQTENRALSNLQKRSSIHIRIPSLIEFSLHEKRKHHFELTQTCTF